MTDRRSVYVDLSDEATCARIKAMTDRDLAYWFRVAGNDSAFKRLLSEEIGRRDALGGKGDQR